TSSSTSAVAGLSSTRRAPLRTTPNRRPPMYSRSAIGPGRPVMGPTTVTAALDGFTVTRLLVKRSIEYRRISVWAEAATAEPARTARGRNTRIGYILRTQYAPQTGGGQRQGPGKPEFSGPENMAGVSFCSESAPVAVRLHEGL